MDTLESSEGANGSAIDTGMCEIKLHDFIARDGTGIRNANGESNGAVRRDLGLACFRVRIVERRKTQTVAEGIERGLGEVAVGTAGHGVVAKGWELGDGLIKSDRKPSRGIEIAGKNIGDGSAAFRTGIPGLDDGGSVLLRPIHGERAAICEDHDERLSRGRDGFQKFLLGPGKIQVQAIASEKTRIA